VVEDHPLSVDIGEWVIDSALAQMEAWQASGFDIPVSVNVGALQLQKDSFVGTLRMLLAAHPLIQPFQLELEVLETSALQDVATVSEVFDACRKIGVLFALDDFGTGYSSLTYLKRLPLNQLKIDRSFVRDILTDASSGAIAETIISLGRAMKMPVIAEGVETEEQRIYLARLGCHAFQGYLTSRPLPRTEFEDLLAAFNSTSVPYEE
jgi:EAL domain-containing protein (putative c-di-GMP-specific phosphodiesterase class I)